MNRILAITRDPDLVERLENELADLRVSITSASDWSEGREILGSDSPEGLLVDSDRLDSEDLQVVAEFDRLLSGRSTVGLLFVRREATHGDELRGALTSFDVVEEIDAIVQAVRRLDEASAAASSEEEAAQGSANAIEGPSVERRLPRLRTDEFESVEPLLFVRSAVETEFGGAIRFENNRLERRVAFRSGSILCSDSEDFSDPGDLLPVFSWDGAVAAVRGEIDLNGETVDTPALVLSGIRTHLPERRALDVLMPQFESIPVVSDRWTVTDSQVRDDDVLATLLDACDGRRSLEEIVVAVGGDEREQFRAAYFAAKWGLMVFADEPTAAPAAIDYELQSTDAVESPEGETEEETLRKRLAARKRRLEEMSHDEVFGVSEGCGEGPIRERYYDFVHEYHPDTYGLELSDETRRLAEDVFRGLERAYRELLARESGGGDSERTDSSVGDEPNGSVLERGSGVERDRVESADAPRTSGAGDDGEAVDRGGRPSGDPSEGDGNGAGTHPPHEDEGPESREMGDRASKIEKLRERAGSSQLDAMLGREPIGEDDAQEFFNTGYKAYKKEHEEIAFELIRKAHDHASDNGLYKTFYGYLMFLTDPDRAAQAREILEDAIELDNRQALTDAHLFLGRILKVQDETSRAERHFRKALELDPTSLEAKRELRVYRMREEGESVEDEPGASGATGEGDEEATSFTDDPLGYVKSLLQKDIF